MDIKNEEIFRNLFRQGFNFICAFHDHSTIKSLLVNTTNRFVDFDEAEKYAEKYGGRLPTISDLTLCQTHHMNELYFQKVEYWSSDSAVTVLRKYVLNFADGTKRAVPLSEKAFLAIAITL